MADLNDTSITDPGFIKLPAGTTAQRPGSAPNGALRYNTETSSAEVFEDGSWKSFPSFLASGGTEYTNGSYKYHVFTESGVFTAKGATSAKVLIVAGGGSGASGGESGGGGGAGGVVQGDITLGSGTWAVKIGAGGPSTSGNNMGNDGQDSSFGPYVARGGGGGGWQNGTTNNNGRPGGSGGGGSGIDSSEANTIGGASTQETAIINLIGYGNTGGTTTTGNGDMGSGGGGATAVGGNGNNGPGTYGGSGGAGLDVSAQWSDTYIQNFGDSGIFGGGGGGGSNFTSAGTGGAGGGGNGGLLNTGQNAQANTGGGGGGAQGSRTTGAGGSGIVIIRYTT